MTWRGSNGRFNPFLNKCVPIYLLSLLFWLLVGSFGGICYDLEVCTSILATGGIKITVCL